MLNIINIMFKNFCLFSFTIVVYVARVQKANLSFMDPFSSQILVVQFGPKSKIYPKMMNSSRRQHHQLSKAAPWAVGDQETVETGG